MPTKIKLPTTEKILGPNGRLAAQLPGYENRREQVAACKAIDEAIRKGCHCLVEAGTGVGKSLAYLIPAVRAIADGATVVISTHTINLQSQLMLKDIPLVASLFPEVEVTAVLMKGRGNYLCRQDLEAAEADIFHASDPLFHRLRGWSNTTQSGDVADLPFTFQGWHEVSANPDTCRHAQCRYFDRCFYYKMRGAAGGANLIVVNHALFLTDLTLRRAEPQSAILPEYDLVIFDEAHHLEDIATKAFGIEVGNRRIPVFTERLRRLRELDLNTDRLKALDALNEALFGQFSGQRQEFFVSEALGEEGEKESRDHATQICAVLEGVQGELAEHAKDVDEVMKDRLQGLARSAGRLREELQALMFNADPDYIRWGQHSLPPSTESRNRSHPRTTLHYTPIAVDKLFAEMLWNNVGTAVLTSATLANSGGFAFLRSRLGIPDSATELIVGSPFDLKSQALLYVPGHLPAPPKVSVPAYAEALADEIERLLKLTKGRAFLLFTSRRMLNELFELLQTRLPFALFKQGDMPPAMLLDAFRKSEDGCLFGNQTFWEGVDVQGEALSCVIIDRIPFAVPDAPITRARTDAIAKAGGDWFNEYSVPQAQIRLKQGFGRLIRTTTDRGIVCVLDSRLITRDYGAELVRYLPGASRASIWTRVERFWHSLNKGDAK